MLTKFETKSNRVKGLCFHPKRPWVLASLHNGLIQLWDYRMGTLIDKFDEHDGPVRGVDFHKTQPLFVSGGDDYKIKVWNHKQKRCLFTLTGHVDYIRTVFFHHEYPWILSSSDDQTVRIWNWQSRTCISILTGHNHYVMCAQFHPKEDLVVSASLDQTVRVWDISGLRKKAAMPGLSSFEDNNKTNQTEFFGSTDAFTKYVLEGHDRGVNWAAFHPTLHQLIVSAADDRLVKLWRMSETKAWEVDTCRGHFSNVSSVIFHPRQDLIISNSEDKTIRIWDMTKRTGVQTIRREHDRFWILAAHPDQNLFAAGHDSGLMVFKLERERPAYVYHQGTLFYVKDKYVRAFEFATNRDTPLISIRRGGSAQFQPPRNMSYNPTEHAILISIKDDVPRYELYTLPREANTGDANEVAPEPKKGYGSSAVFVYRDRFAVLDRSRQIQIRNMKNELTKQLPAPSNTDALFYAGTGNLLLRSEDSVTLYDMRLKKVVAELSTPPIRHVVWSNDMNTVALLGKHSVTLATKKLEQLCIIHESIRVKSGAWDDNGIFIYSTLNHLKYALQNGDSGIVGTLEQPLYVTHVKADVVFALDREGKPRMIKTDPTEYLFKLALIQRKYDDVLNIIRNSNLVGQAIIAYLQKKGYSEIALHFVRDDNTRFGLALECGNINVAVETAQNIDRPEIWKRLAEEAFRQGNVDVVEMALERLKDYNRLSFLHLLLGDTDKLKKQIKLAEIRNDTMGRYEYALMLGNAEEQLRVLKETHQHALAYHIAVANGFDEEAQALLQVAGKNAEEVGEVLVAKNPLPPQPVSQQRNWPLLTMSKGVFDTALSKNGPSEQLLAVDTNLDVVGDEWGGDLDVEIGDDGEPIIKSSTEPVSAGGEGDEAGWDLEDDELKLELENVKDVGVEVTHGYFVPPPNGPSDPWGNRCVVAAEFILAGNFETAMQLLNTQVGIVNFEPLKPIFMNLFMSSHSSAVAMNSLPSLLLPICSQPDTVEVRNSRPHVYLEAKALTSMLQEALTATTAGKFSEAIVQFRDIIYNAILVVATNKNELTTVQQMIATCREYLLGLNMEAVRKSLKDDASSSQRVAELAAYFTHCNLQPIHQILSLRSAMTIHFKLKNYISASSFAQRLLELGPKAEVATQARKLQAICDKTPQNELKINYDEHNPFVICGRSFTPIYRGSKTVQCPLCGASFLPQYHGTLCSVCQVAEIGLSGSGLRIILDR